MTEATAAYGTELRWNNEAIAEVVNIGGPNLTFDQIDCTHYQSPNHFKEFITGFGDGGEITMECTLIPGDTLGQRAFLDDARDKESGDVTLHLGNPVVAVWAFEGVVIRLDFTQPMDNRLQFTATIKVSGEPALAFEDSAGMSALTGTEQNGPGDPLTFVPTFHIDTFSYAATVDTASAWVTVTPFAAGHTIRGRIDKGTWFDLTHDTASGQIAIGDANSQTELQIQCWEPDEIAKTYTIYISRP